MGTECGSQLNGYRRQSQCDTLPLAWHFIDAEMTMPAKFPFDEIKRLLERALTDAFWQLPPT
ncbi:HipA family kinase [Duganella caerulea]|uniref:HipA family kinase n=1 Tax=Duganella caerulea TaxID=2885762 RepID=UPI004037901C